MHEGYLSGKGQPTDHIGFELQVTMTTGRCSLEHVLMIHLMIRVKTPA